MLTVTLNQIKKHQPDKDDWERLLAYLGKTKADDEPLPLTTILESNGFDHAVWCLRVLPLEYDGKIRLFACDVAERVLHIYEAAYPDDRRPRDCINTAGLYAEGKATYEQLKTASAAARDAAWAAASAAARDAAWAATWTEVDATWAIDAEDARATDAEAVCAAARDAARNAARDAASDAVWDAAWAAAMDAEKAEQAKLFIKHFGGTDANA